MSDPAYPYTEAGLATFVGLPRGEFKSLRDRHLKKKRDWANGSSGHVSLTRKAAQDILERLSIADSQRILDQLAVKKNGAVEAPGAPLLLGDGLVRLQVTKIPLNPAMVLCSDADGRPHSVYVGRHENFVVGMVLEALPYPGQPGIYQLNGPRPRQRGRW